MVPDFQRPYSWDIDELEDYWNDVVLANGDFFFGSTVTWISEKRELFNNTYSIIDGQQRLTTSAIILSVIRDAFEIVANDAVDDAVNGEDGPDFASQARAQMRNTQRYLIVEDDDGKKYPVIARNEPNFREVVQNPSAIPSGVKWNRSARQIGVARTFFETKVQAVLADLDVEKRIEILKDLRSNVLKARLIQVELNSEEDGFLIFETLNTRGADLRAADLVKNLLVRGGASEPADRATIAYRWDRMVDRVQGDSGSMDIVDQFLWQSWNSRRAAVTEAELYKNILEFVGATPARHIQYLEEVEFDSIAYQYLERVEFSVDREILDPDSALLVKEVVETFRALALFNVSVANSALLAIVRKYEKQPKKLMVKRDLVAACRAIESFHFQFTALTASGSTGGTRGRYNRFAVELEEAGSRADVASAIKAFQERLQGSLPTEVEAKEAFASLFYAPKARLRNAEKRRSRKIFITYILLRFAQYHKALTLDQGLSDWTIEHIRPQSLASGKVTDVEYSIGNLALLTDGANGELADGTFGDKRAGLAEYMVWKDAEIDGWLRNQGLTVLEASQIRDRARKMADLAVDSVWSIV